VVVLPGPPSELRALWRRDRDHGVLAAVAGRTVYDERMLRLYGLPESEIAETLRIADATGVPMERLEVTTCLRRGEIEIVTRFEAPDASAYDAFAAVVRSRHGEMLFSRISGASTIRCGDARRAALTVAVAESCTGGLLAGASASVRDLRVPARRHRRLFERDQGVLVGVDISCSPSTSRLG